MKILTQERLKELLDYDSETGVFTRRVSRGGCKSGSVTGTLIKKGYVQITVHGKIYKAHRLAWLYTYGYFPENDVGHKNRIKNDNRIDNLREASRQCILRNAKLRSTNTSGVTGVYYYKPTKKWAAHIKTSQKLIHLGYFTNFAQAVQARWDAEVKYNFPNCNTTSTAYQYLQGGPNEK
ncbi:MAG: hypothetical protein DRJ03_03335 [Chloroflexi bacterium]|nr:MAG: hypothetical protein DRJ03_03335 [Chloroflexota bacterium]